MALHFHEGVGGWQLPQLEVALAQLLVEAGAGVETGLVEVDLEEVKGLGCLVCMRFQRKPVWQRG